MIGQLLRRWKQRRTTVSAWAVEYEEILRSWHLSHKTTCNRLNCVRHVCHHLGGQYMQDLRPADIARMVTAIWRDGRAFTARRVQYEAESMFHHAMIAGLVDRNPVTSLKAPPAAVARSRLSMEHWQAIHEWASRHGQPWFAYALRLALVSAQRRSDLIAMRKDHVIDGHLRVAQQKTGMRIELPLSLRLEALGVTLGDVITESDDYRRPGMYLLRKRDDVPFGAASLSASFASARDRALDRSEWGDKLPATFHEIRSLSERLYRAQGVDTRMLLGHRRQSMTDQYNDDRGLTDGDWKRLEL